MNRREMNSLAHSLYAFLCSRNNDIQGYWGIGGTQSLTPGAQILHGQFLRHLRGVANHVFGRIGVHFRIR